MGAKNILLGAAAAYDLRYYAYLKMTAVKMVFIVKFFRGRGKKQMGGQLPPVPLWVRAL